MHQQQTAFENIVGKGEITRKEQFLLFPQCFLLNQKIVSPFVHISYIISLFPAELEEPKIGISGKGIALSISALALSLGPHSPTMLKNILSLFIQEIVYLKVTQTSYWLNHMI